MPTGGLDIRRHCSISQPFQYTIVHCWRDKRVELEVRFLASPLLWIAGIFFVIRDRQAKAIHSVRPEFPEILRSLGVSGVEPDRFVQLDDRVLNPAFFCQRNCIVESAESIVRP